MVCGEPPDGRSRWTVRLVAEVTVKRKPALRVGREAARILLLHHDLKPWREKMQSVADLGDQYIEKIENALETYDNPMISQSQSFVWTRIL
jgi:hypothetical protein